MRFSSRLVTQALLDQPVELCRSHDILSDVPGKSEAGSGSEETLGGGTNDQWIEVTWIDRTSNGGVLARGFIVLGSQLLFRQGQVLCEKLLEGSLHCGLGLIGYLAFRIDPEIMIDSGLDRRRQGRELFLSDQRVKLSRVCLGDIPNLIVLASEGGEQNQIWRNTFPKYRRQQTRKSRCFRGAGKADDI